MAVPNLQVDLPWQSLAAGGNALAGLGGDPGAALGQLGQSYNQQYQAALGMNSALYSGLQGGYEGLRSHVDDQYRNVLQGYQDVYGDVLGRIAGTNSTNIQDINTQYNAQQGAQNQNAINRGLGNSTVAGNMMRGVEMDRARAITDSQNRFAQLGANYASQIGQARLGAQQQGIGLGANLGQAQLGALERVNAPYPDAGLYANLAQMYGAQRQQQRANQGAYPMIQAGGGTNRPPSPFGSRDPTGGGFATQMPGGGGGYGLGSSGFGGGYFAGGYGVPNSGGGGGGWSSSQQGSGIPYDGYFGDSSGVSGAAEGWYQNDYGEWSNYDPYASPVSIGGWEDPGNLYMDEYGGTGSYDDPGFYDMNYDYSNFDY